MQREEVQQLIQEALGQQQQQHQGQLQQQQAQNQQQLEQLRREYEVRLDELRRGAPQSHQRLLDTKGLERPAKFSGTETDWSGFSFRFENWLVALLGGHVREWLRWAEAETEPIDENSLKAPTNMTTEQAKTFSRQMWLGLAQLVDQEALAILKNGDLENGLDAWRRLTKRYDPVTAGVMRLQYLRLVQPGVAKDTTQAAVMIQQWETAVREFEQRTRKTIDEELKIAVLTEMMPGDLRQHLQLNARSILTYAVARKEIAMYLETKNAPGTAAGTMDQAVPMDVGALWAKGGKSKKGENKGKGKGAKGPTVPAGKGKGKGKDQGGGGSKGAQSQTGKPSGKNNPVSKKKFDGKCWHCGKTGHKSSECWNVKAANLLSEAEGGQRSEGSNSRGDAGTGAAQEISGVSLCYFGDANAPHLGLVAEAQATSSGQVLDTVVAHVDSGAAVTVIPPGWFEESYPLERKEVNKYKVANGEVVESYGIKTLQVRVGDAVGSLRCVVAPVSTMLLSVSALAEKGNEVHFSKGNAHIKTAIGYRLPLVKRRGVYEVSLAILAPEGPQEKTGKGASSESYDKNAWRTLSPLQRGEATGSRDTPLERGEEEGSRSASSGSQWIPGNAGRAVAEAAPVDPLRAEEGEEEEPDEELVPRVVRDPGQPSKEEMERHSVTHLPYRAWCPSCVTGRGRNAAHKALDEEKDRLLPTIAHDFAFLGRDDQQTCPVLVSKSSRTLWLAASVVPSKTSTDEYTVGCVVSAIKQMGHARFIHKSDQESAMKKLKDEAMKQLPGLEAIPEESPVKESRSNGMIEVPFDF